MATDSEHRWPRSVNGDSLTQREYDPTGRRASTAVISAATEALDAESQALPTLNDRIDPDYVGSLLAAASDSPRDGVRAALEVSLDEVIVLLHESGRAEVFPKGQASDGLDPSTVVRHDWSSAESLIWSIGRAVATVSDVSPTRISKRLTERTDADAINRLLRPRAAGTERSDGRLLLSVEGHEVAVDAAGSIAVEPSLEVLKRSGAALLVVGSVPEQGFDRAAATLLGDPAAARAPTFVLHGQDVETARRRLSMAGMSQSSATVVEHRARARSASTAGGEDTRHQTDEPAVVRVSGGIEALPETVREAVGDDASYDPGEFRLCVDSISSMVDTSGLATADDVVDSLCRTVRSRRGLGTFLLPADPAGQVVESLASSFDAVVELRTGDVDMEQRWRLTGTGHETNWFPLG